MAVSGVLDLMFWSKFALDRLFSRARANASVDGVRFQCQLSSDVPILFCGNKHTFYESSEIYLCHIHYIVYYHPFCTYPEVLNTQIKIQPDI